MFDSLALALSVAVASTHLEAREVTQTERFHYAAGPIAGTPVNAQKMVAQLNDVRASAGLPLLSSDERLSEIAIEHAQEMIAADYFGHSSPDGTPLSQRFSKHGVHAEVIGENLAWSGDLREAAISLWQSAEHQRNECDPRFHHVGVAMVRTGETGTLFVQIFTE